jgi:hypothetical protein
MLNTYIKNRGHTETLIHNNNQNKFNEIDWDADYDGNVANISLTSAVNGNPKHYDIQLDNEDLANILNVPSVNMPIHKRLEMDFNRPLEPKIYQIELPYIRPDPEPAQEPLRIQYINKPKPNKIEELVQAATPKNYLSTPLPNEELIIPLTIDKKSFNNLLLNPRRRYLNKTRKNKRKNYKTYRVYKKRKNPSSRRKTSTSKRHIYL